MIQICLLIILLLYYSLIVIKKFKAPYNFQGAFVYVYIQSIYKHTCIVAGIC